MWTITDECLPRPGSGERGMTRKGHKEPLHGDGDSIVRKLYVSRLTLFFEVYNLVTDLREPTDGGEGKASKKTIHNNQVYPFEKVEDPIRQALL